MSQTSSSKKTGNRKRTKPTFIEQARRKQILDAAVQMFAQNGFNETSIDEIAESVGVSRGVIFYYFAGKRELGEQTILQGLRDYGQYVQARMAQRRTPRTKLLEFSDACLDYLGERRLDYLTFIDTMGCFGSRAEKYDLFKKVNKNTRGLLVELIEDGQKSGEFSPVPKADLADVIQGSIDGLMELCAVEPDVVDIKGCKRILRKMIESAISP